MLALLLLTLAMGIVPDFRDQYTNERTGERFTYYNDNLYRVEKFDDDGELVYHYFKWKEGFDKW